jgi:quercetin dioxygenase-like cupin family protein
LITEKGCFRENTDIRTGPLFKPRNMRISNTLSVIEKLSNLVLNNEGIILLKVFREEVFAQNSLTAEKEENMAYFYNFDKMESDLITPKYSPARGPKIEGEKILMGRWFYPKGPGAKRHKHPNDQLVYVLKGKMRICIGDEENICGPGEGWHIPPNTEHGGGEYLEDTELIVCKDIVPGWSLKNARWENKE